MPNTYTQIYLHFVFSPKNRECLIHEKIENELHQYITGIVKNLGQNVIQINGMNDHIHLLVRMRSSMSSSELFQKVKSNSSRWINNKFFPNKAFKWQTGGAIFSVDHSRIPQLKKYIINQKEHHKGVIFKNEYIALLKEYGIEFEKSFLLEFNE